MRVLPASWSAAASSSAKLTATSSSSNSAEDPPPPAAAAVYLNIYDISPLNHYLYWFGLGIFHSGIEVHGMEYGFGAHEYPTSGVFQVEPKTCPGFIFRRSVCVGTTDMSRSQVRTCIEDLAEDYHGDTYHLIVKNCNHFTADVCQRLTGKPAPGWVNRLARLGSFFNCVLPESIKVSTVRDVNAHPGFSGTLPTSRLNCFCTLTWAGWDLTMQKPMPFDQRLRQKFLPSRLAAPDDLDEVKLSLIYPVLHFNEDVR